VNTVILGTTHRCMKKLLTLTEIEPARLSRSPCLPRHTHTVSAAVLGMPSIPHVAYETPTSACSEVYVAIPVSRHDRLLAMCWQEHMPCRVKLVLYCLHHQHPESQIGVLYQCVVSIHKISSFQGLPHSPRGPLRIAPPPRNSELPINHIVCAFPRRVMCTCRKKTSF